MPDKSLSSNLLNMKFMQRGSEPAQAPKPKDKEPSAGGWSVPDAYRPKRQYKSNQVGLSELEQPEPGRVKWKNGQKKLLLEDEEPEVAAVEPEPVKRKSEKQGKPKQKKRPRQSK